MKKNLLVVMVLMVTTYMFAQTSNNVVPVYLDETQPLDKRIDDALKRMTLKEKVAMFHAQSKFSSPGVPRLGIPEIWFDDGPHGVKADIHWDSWDYAGCTDDSCTAFPSLTCLAATWNPSMSYLYGKALGEEARYRNKDVILGPTINIYRTPLGGRNFESMGEDPYLTSVMVVPYIQGVQSNGVGACVKHFAVNNQEAYRLKVNVVVSERALHEIYLPAFKTAAIKGKAWTFMGAYNKYKGEYCSYNPELVQEILKKEWGFDGVLMSDWGGTHDTKNAALGGLDLEMGTDEFYPAYFFSTPLLKAVKAGQIPEKVIDEKVRRILRLDFRTSMNRQRPWGSFATAAHDSVCRKISQEGIVLLKNDDLLPIKTGKYKNILVIGENAIKKMTVGGGSSELKVAHEILPLDGIRARFGKETSVKYTQGYVSSYQGCQSRGAYAMDAIKMAKDADLIIYVGGLNKQHGQDCEQADREDMDLPYNQDKLINKLSELHKPVVVLIISGNAVSMPWEHKVGAILQTWYGGSEAGNAIADILSGDVNPSGKLPFSIPVKLTDNSAFSPNGGEYPGNGDTVHYKDGIFVGYRWLEKENIKPLFSFGHGLSYTSFLYHNATINKTKFSVNDSIRIKIPVSNTGKFAGEEVVQLYITDVKSNLPRPKKELKAFKKIFLKVGETKNVDFVLGKDALSYYDDRQHKWTVDSGEFIAKIGSASDDIRKEIKFRVY